MYIFILHNGLKYLYFSEYVQKVLKNTKRGLIYQVSLVSTDWGLWICEGITLRREMCSIIYGFRAAETTSFQVTCHASIKCGLWQGP